MRARLPSPPVLALAALLAALSLVLATTLAGRGQTDDRGVVASLISRALSTPTTHVSIGDVQGALSSDVTLRNITISDRDGVWFELDRVRLIWRRTALLQRRLEVDRLEIGTLTLRRGPLSADEPVAGADEPILPELPLKVEIKAFELQQLALGAALAGTDARLTASGAASLGNPSEGLDLRFDARRLDAPGTASARLQLVPQTETLTLALKLDEPEGGVFAHAFNVPGRPPVRLDLEGSGTLDAFAARLDFAAGHSIGADGAARLRRDGAARRLELALAAQIEGLLPSLAAPVFAGTTRLDGTIVFADAGAIDIAPITVRSQTARLNVEGRLSSDNVADLTISARNLPNAGDRTAAAGAEIGSLAFDAAIAGPITAPRVAATLALREARLPQGSVSTLDARFTASPDGSATEPTTPVPFTLAAQASGIAPKDPALARALGSSLTLAADGTWRDGVLTTDNARLHTPTAEARFAGQAGGSRLQGRLTAQIPELARFGHLAGLDLKGGFSGRAELSGVPKDGLIEAVIDARAERFSTGIAAVDGLAGGRLNVAGVVRKLPRGGYGFGDLRLTGAHATARVDGEATVAQANIDARMDIPDLRRADARLSGRAEAVVKLTGTLEQLGATASAVVTDARALGRPIPRLAIGIAATDVTGAPDVQVTLTGTVDGKTAAGRARVVGQSSGGWEIDGLDLTVGSVHARGDLRLDASTLASGRLAIDARNLDDLSPLVLTRLAGRLQADVALAVANGGQNASLSATGQAVKVGNFALERMAARVEATDVWRRPVLDADVTVDRATIGGESFSRVRLTSTGLPGGSDISIGAQARDFALEARGQLVRSDDVRLELAAFTARRGGRRVALASPATLTFVDGGVDIRNLVLALDAGRLRVAGRAASTLDLSIAATAVPLSAADIVMPQLRLSGTLNAEAQLRGSAAEPTGPWKLRIARLAAAQFGEFGLPAMDVAAEGQLADGRTSVDASLRAGRAGDLRLAGTVPLSGDDLDLAVRGRLDLAAANAALGAGGRSVSGRADIDARLRGSLAQPEVSGGAVLTGGTYTDALLGVQLTGIAGRLSARGDEVIIERLTAQTPSGGTISAQGQVRLDPAGDLPGRIQVTGRGARLASSDVVQATANLVLDISGPLARDPRIAGRVDFMSLQTTVPDRLPTTLRPIPGTRHVNPGPTARARLAAEARSRARAAGGAPFDATLDLLLSAPNRVFVRGRGIDAELGGELRLSGRMSEPVSNGAFVLRRGRMQIGSHRLEFTRGRLAFTGDFSPDLDFLAQTRAGDVTAHIAVTGPASQPNFVFTSDPELPEDEVLSRILFGKPSGGLTAAQALQLAQIAAQFSGEAGGSGIFETMRRSLGVDSLDISTGAGGDPTVGLSRAVGNRLSVGVKAGAKPEDTAVSVDIDVTRRIRVQTELGATGEPAVGIGAEWEY